MAITISGANNVDKILATDGVLDSISGFNVVGVMTAGTFDVTGKTTTGHLNIGSNIQIGNAGIITATTLIGNVTGNINATSNLLLQIGGSEKFRVASSGQLGIGGANYGSAGQVLTSGGSGSAPTWSTIASDKITEGNTEAEVVDTGSDGYFKVTTEGSERLRIDSSGDVLIGTTDDAIYGDSSGEGIVLRSGECIDINRTGDSMLNLNRLGSDGPIMNFRRDGSVKAALGTRSNAFCIDVNGSERLRIRSDGKLGINTTTTNDSSELLCLMGPSGDNATIGIKCNSTIHAGILGFHDTAGTFRGRVQYSHNTDHMQFNTAGSERLRIGSNGLLTVNATTYDALTINTTENGTNGPQVQLTHISASPAAGDYVGQLRFSGKDSAGNTDLYSRISTVIDDPTSGQETAHLQFSTRGAAAFNPILRLKNRGTASAPSYTTDDINGIILDVYNTGNPYPRYMNFIAKSAGNTDSNIGFWTEAVGGSPTEKLRIASDGFIGIGEDDPQTKLDVRGTISTGRNVARELGTIINISANYDGSRVGGNVINGNKNYEAGADWLVNFPANANLTIDLGSSIQCDRFVIYNQNEYQDSKREVKNFTLEGSNDNSSWTTVLDDNCGASGAHEPNPGFSFRMPASYYDDDEGVSYRYWKFTMKTFHGSDGYGGVMELELYAHSTTIHGTSEIITSSLVAGDTSAETLQGIKRLYASKGMNIYTSGISDTWEITETGQTTNGSYIDKSTIRHKRGVMAVSSSYNSGDLFIRIDNLYPLSGNAWWVCGLTILSNEIQGGQGGAHHYVTSLQLMGLGTWNSVSTQNIVGSMSVSVNQSGSNYVELFVNVNDSSRGPCTVICNGGTFDPPRISFH